MITFNPIFSNHLWIDEILGESAKMKVYLFIGIFLSIRQGGKFHFKKIRNTHV
jgi:hypothetical protein